MTMMVRSFKFNIPDVVVAVLMLLLMAMANNEVAVNADIIAAPVGASGHESSDHMLVVAGDNHRGLHDITYHCENDPDFLYKGVSGQDCGSWVPLRDDNCRKSQEIDGTQTGKQVKFYCPLRCKSKCECVNDPDFLYKGVPGQDCDSWVLEGGSDSNCRKVQEDADGNQTGKEVKFYCPQQCKSKCAPKRGKCENDPDFLYKGVPGQDCESWALLKPDSCRKDQKDADGKQTGKQVKFYCPEQCKSKCDKCIVKDPCTSEKFETLFVVSTEFTILESCETRFDQAAVIDERESRCQEKGNLLFIVTKLNSTNYQFNEVYTDEEAYDEHKLFQHYQDFAAVFLAEGDDQCLAAFPLFSATTIVSEDPNFPPPTTQLSCSM